METRKGMWVDWDKCPIPERTETYEPMPHQELLDLIEERLALQGYTITSRSVAQNTKGTVITFMLNVASDEHPDMTMMVGGMNSYDKSRAIKIAAGAKVYICGNGMIVSDLFTFRMHTSKLRNDLTDLIDKVVGQLEATWKKTVRDVQQMVEVPMTDDQTAELYGKLYLSEGIITLTELAIAGRELKKPTYDSFKEKNLWSSYNHVTFALKKAPPRRQLEALKALHEYCMQIATDYHAVSPYDTRGESIL